MTKRFFERTKTREGMENEKEWCKGYVFEAVDISDILVCERGTKEFLGRMHLATSVKEITKKKVDKAK